MKREKISYDAYREEIMRIYRDLRREGYYYSLLIDLFEDCLINDVKVIPVYLNTGYKDNAISKTHDRSKYADSNSLQDIIIVPNQYTYENTTNPYVSIEVKKPNIKSESGVYSLLKVVGRNLKQLKEEFRYCNYIIFTDCITWYFLKDYKSFDNKVCLFDVDNGKWKTNIYIWNKLKDKISEFVNDAKQKNLIVWI